VSDYSAREQLEQAYDRLQRDLPDRAGRLIRTLRGPNARWIRIPAGVVLIILSFFWFLPVIGIEFLPMGLALIAQDVPVLQRPVARFIIAADRKWLAVRHWWHQRRHGRRHP
jgi:hypothetical protein